MGELQKINLIISDSIFLQWVVPAALIIAGVILGFIFDKLILAKLKKLLEKTKWDGVAVVIRAMRKVAMILFTAAGVSAAVNYIPMSATLYNLIQRILLVVIIFAITLVVARIGTGFMNLYSMRAKGALPSISIFSHLTTLLVFLIGIMIILQSLGISITPLLTALGVGGLAVALALQDTLTNFFAGLVVIASGQIRRGDYVELENGIKGYVTDITWKNTTIRAIPDNMIIVPNAKLSSTIITNYYQPRMEMIVRVEVGVSYDSDLAHVERVTNEVAGTVMRDVEGGVPDFTPYIRFHTFSDFSINFTVVMRANEYFNQYVVKHEFVKRLHERYKAEGITIPFPIRTIHMEDKAKGKLPGN